MSQEFWGTQLSVLKCKRGFEYAPKLSILLLQSREESFSTIKLEAF